MALAQTTLLTRVLRHLPSRLIAALDAWSYRIAQKRAQRRREAGRRASAATGKLRSVLKS
jgi:hypothetical protein